MPRNGSGTYTLPAGQPVVTGTTIDSTVHNAFASDVATALTGSLAANGERTASGNLPMGTFKITGLGNASADTDALNRVTADARYPQLGASNTLTSDQLISSAAPRFDFNETDAAANNRRWRVYVNGEALSLDVVNDANDTAVSFMTVNRTANTVDSIALAATAITVNGVNATDFARLSQSNTFTGATQTISAAQPYLRWIENDAAANNQRWALEAQGERFIGLASNDDESVNTAWLLIDRTGTTVDSIAFAATAITFNGVNVNSAAIITGGTFGAANASNLTALNATNLASGTVPDARFPATLPAASGANLTALNATNLASGTVAAGRMPALTGDVTTSAGAVATTIANDAVTYAKMQNVSATSRVLGRITSGAGDVEELTAANLNTILSIAGGDYVPSISNDTNVASSVLQAAQYMRVGDVVTVSGVIFVTCTNGVGNPTVLIISLPVASNFGSEGHLGGGGAHNNSAVTVYASITGDSAVLSWFAGTTSGTRLSFNFSYRII